MFTYISIDKHKLNLVAFVCFRNLCNHKCAPPVNFNVEGNLLAVSTADNKIKILATSDGVKLLHKIQDLAAARLAANPVAKVSSIVVVILQHNISLRIQPLSPIL